ncbi:SRPBCC family protein [Demequina lignilytica]|uniref:SRPBCC family protein n=1 Tax=Demequina lignilytica TaxID=3051663 RepID=A0AAW7M4H7_9MICO|nr:MULTISPECIES: SRPBCC family protein [unclassified Demequina]MDN4479244.1 SRPBCC family protein [Demequina sp. SYSU T00039-1]MDN4483120.1 SRPBCC family protein [Demequina sp. SYSU T0a273]MDN4487562.1 SRPBCC family protein [Demequina sp. SYSU T00039]MDN4490968.1 SRPBCC family protein [Demequina sp. SYSU T00068]
MTGPLDVAVEREGLVPATAKDVWRCVTEPDLRVEVFSMVTQAVTEAGEPGQVGHVLQFSEIDAGSDPVVVRLTTIEVEPYRRLVQERVGPDGTFTSSTFLEETQDGTHVRRVFHVYKAEPSVAERAMRKAISTFFTLGGTVRLKADIGDLIRHFS